MSIQKIFRGGGKINWRWMSS